MIAPWFVSNYLRFGRLLEGRAPSSRTLLENAHALASALVNDCALPIGIAVAVVLLSRWGAIDLRRLRAIPPGWLAPVAFVVMYAVSLPVLGVLSHFDPIDTRLASPIYAPLALTTIIAAAWATGRDRPGQPLSSASIVALAAIMLVVGTVDLGQAVRQLSRSDRTERPVDAWIRDHTQPMDLFIGADPGWLLVRHRRPVLRGYAETPLTSPEVARFLNERGAPFSNWYVIETPTDQAQLLGDDPWRELTLTRVFDDGAYVIDRASVTK